MTNTPDEWLSTTDVAELAGVPKTRVYQAADTGGLPAYRIGRHFRFRRVEVEAWLARRDEVGSGQDDEG